MKQQCFGLADANAELAIPFGLSGLFLQGRDLPIKSHKDVFKTFKVLFGIFQSKFGFVAARMQAGNPGSFFQNQAALTWFCTNQRTDFTLGDHGCGPRTGRGIGKQQLHIARPHILAIYPVI